VRKSKFTERQIAFDRRQVGGGTAVECVPKDQGEGGSQGLASGTLRPVPYSRYAGIALEYWGAMRLTAWLAACWRPRSPDSIRRCRTLTGEPGNAGDDAGA